MAAGATDWNGRRCSRPCIGGEIVQQRPQDLGDKHLDLAGHYEESVCAGCSEDGFCFGIEVVSYDQAVRSSRPSSQPYDELGDGGQITRVADPEEHAARLAGGQFSLQSARGGAEQQRPAAEFGQLFEQQRGFAAYRGDQTP